MESGIVRLFKVSFNSTNSLQTHYMKSQIINYKKQLLHALMDDSFSHQV